MLYNQIPQTQQVTVQHTGTLATQAFSCDSASLARNFRVPWGQQPQWFTTSGAGGVLNAMTPGRAGFAPNLISCALCVYIYEHGGQVQQVALFHAHTGLVPANHSPLDPSYNLLGTNANDIHVVFASSQASTPHSPGSGIQTAANGLFTFLADGIPLGNIRVLLSASTFGGNIDGDVGLSPGEAFLGADFENAVLHAAAAASAKNPNPIEALALKQLMTAAAGLGQGLTTPTALATSVGTVMSSLGATTIGSPCYEMVCELYRRLIGNPAGVIGAGNARTWGRRIVDAMKRGV